MSDWLEREQTLVRFLLGQLPAEEENQIERQLFAEDTLHEELQATADDLIRAYLAGQLSHDQRQRFEARFLSSAPLRKRLEFLQDLQAAVERESAAAPPRAWLRWPIAAALLAALAALLALTVHRSPQPQRASVADPAGSLLPETTPPTTVLRGEAPAAPEPAAPRKSAVRFVRLPEPATERPVEVALASGTRSVRLEVRLPTPGYPSFDAAIQGPDGSETWRDEGLTPLDGTRLVLNVPASAFGTGDHILLVEGERFRDNTTTPPPPARYRLRVLRKP